MILAYIIEISFLESNTKLVDMLTNFLQDLTIADICNKMDASNIYA